jgi:hypothetical protein
MKTDEQRRIDELEEKVWTLRGRIANLAAALCVVSVFLAAAGLTAATTPEPKVVRATRFVLVDAQGKDVATWSVEQSGEDRGNVRLSMRNVALTATPDGYAALIVGTGGPRTEITASPRSSGIAVWGKDNKLEFTTAK